jgi:hypothetical protein
MDLHGATKRHDLKNNKEKDLLIFLDVNYMTFLAQTRNSFNPKPVRLSNEASACSDFRSTRRDSLGSGLGLARMFG